MEPEKAATTTAADVDDAAELLEKATLDISPPPAADEAEESKESTDAEPAGEEGAAPPAANTLALPQGSEPLIRIFVGDISPATTPMSLAAYFSKFGHVAQAVIKQPSPGSFRMRSFGFISVLGEDVARAIISQPHTIDGQEVGVPERAKHLQHRLGGPNVQYAPPESDVDSAQTRKIFVGGIAQHTKDSMLWSYFGQFGKITGVIVMTEGGYARRSRGFGFVTFEDPATVEAVCQHRYHPIDSRLVEVKPAIPREYMKHTGGKGGGENWGAPGGVYPDGGTYPDVAAAVATHGTVGANMGGAAYSTMQTGAVEDDSAMYGATPAPYAGMMPGYGAPMVPMVANRMPYMGVPPMMPAPYSANTVMSPNGVAMMAPVAPGTPPGQMMAAPYNVHQQRVMAPQANMMPTPAVYSLAAPYMSMATPAPMVAMPSALAPTPAMAAQVPLGVSMPLAPMMVAPTNVGAMPPGWHVPGSTGAAPLGASSGATGNGGRNFQSAPMAQQMKAGGGNGKAAAAASVQDPSTSAAQNGKH